MRSDDLEQRIHLASSIETMPGGHSVGFCSFTQRESLQLPTFVGFIQPYRQQSKSRLRLEYLFKVLILTIALTME